MKASLCWADGRVEELNDVDDLVEVIVRNGVGGTRHFWRTDDVDEEGAVVFIEEFEDEDAS